MADNYNYDYAKLECEQVLKDTKRILKKIESGRLSSETLAAYVLNLGQWAHNIDECYFAKGHELSHEIV